MVRLGDGGGDGDGGGENSKPAWLEGLMEETFFAGCGAHETRRKNEKNIFCLACCLSFCPHCLPSHRSHPLLQVRRYVYHDVVRLVDLQKLIDCSFIQPYTINGAKVIFLKQRTQSSSRSNNRVWKAAAGGGSTSAPNLCFTCDRILQSPFHFCSLSCKVNHVVCQGGEGLTSIWMSSSAQLEGLRLNSALLDDNDNDEEEEEEDDDDNDEGQTIAPNSRSQPEYYYEGPATRNPSSSNAAAETFLKRKKKGGGAAPTTTTDGGSGSGSASRTSRFLSVFSLNNSRRKSAPHRAPLS